MSAILNVDYKTAWHLDHRIREAMQGENGIFGGTVEVDATFHGGTYDKRRKRAPYDKQAVAGVIQRKTEDTHSKVIAFPVPREIAPVMSGVIKNHVASDAAIMTDEHGAYAGPKKRGYKHEIVAHSKDEWVLRQRSHARDRIVLVVVQTADCRPASSGEREAPTPLPE